MGWMTRIHLISVDEAPSMKRRSRQMTPDRDLFTTPWTARLAFSNPEDMIRATP